MVASPSTVSQCAAGCTYPTCIGVVIKRRGSGNSSCNGKLSDCEYQESMDEIQRNGVDQYMCYSGKESGRIL